MRHRKSGRKLGRNTSHRKAMMRNMVTSLFQHDRIKTTDARAKELRKIADKLITLAKRGDLHARRLVAQVVREKKVVARLFDEIAPRYTERPGGYTRIVKLGHRAGDNAALSIIELVEQEFTAKPKKKSAAAIAEAPEADAASVVEGEAGIDVDAAVAAEQDDEPVTDEATAEEAATLQPEESAATAASVDEAEAEEGTEKKD